MSEHVILHRQVSEDGSSSAVRPFLVQAYCHCGWESEVHVVANEVDYEVGQHLYEVWLSIAEVPD